MMKSGFNDWNHETGNQDESTRSAANVANTTEPCSSIAQNKTAAMKSGMYDTTRKRSVAVTLTEAIIQTK